MKLKSILLVPLALMAAVIMSMSCGGGGSGTPTLASIAVTPATPSIAAGATQQFVATATYSDGSTEDITLTVTWGSSDTGVADFETPDVDKGLATGIAAGTATITATDADSSVSGTTDITVAQLSGTIKNLYSTNVAWGTYLANDGADIFTASDTACDAATAGPGYNACLNGGFFRMVTVTGRGVCDDLTATDSLGVFNWVCDNNTNDVRMVAVGFADGKGLSDLIDFDTASWRSLDVTVYRGSYPYLATDQAVIYSKAIAVNNDGSDVYADKVNIVTQNPNAAYSFRDSKATLLIKPGLIIDGAGGAPVVDIASYNFGWLEGAVDATGESGGIRCNGTKFSQLRNVKVQNADAGSQTGIALLNASSNKLAKVIVANSGVYGVLLDNSSNNLLVGVTSFNNNDSEVQLNNASNDNTLLTVTTFASGNEVLYVNNATNNVLIDLTTATGNYPTYVSNSASNNTLMNVAAVGGNEDGIRVENANSTTLANLASANNDYDGIVLDTSTGNYFTGIVKVGNNAHAQCSVQAGDEGIDGSCDPTNSSDFGSPVLGISLLGSFLAQVDSDTVNPDGATGTKAYDSGISDWVNFENPFRGWGIDGTFPTTTYTNCQSGDTCRIWDWSMASADTVVRNALALPTGNDTITHGWTSGSVTFLRNAIEILDDGIGNENGLCESNETCLYTPNIGSYQGHGGLVSAGAFTDGTITGVTLMQYETNGR